MISNGPLLLPRKLYTYWLESFKGGMILPKLKSLKSDIWKSWAMFSILFVFIYMTLLYITSWLYSKCTCYYIKMNPPLEMLLLEENFTKTNFCGFLELAVKFWHDFIQIGWVNLTSECFISFLICNLNGYSYRLTEATKCTLCRFYNPVTYYIKGDS